MKVYAETWATSVLRDFHVCHPRAMSINLWLVQLAYKYGYVLDLDLLNKILIRAIRIPKIGEAVWKRYKYVAKGKHPEASNAAYWRLFFGDMKLTNTKLKEEIDQLELFSMKSIESDIDKQLSTGNN